MKVKARLRRNSREPSSYRDAYDGAFKKPKKVAYFVKVPAKGKKRRRFTRWKW